jgi:hypothetical protein
MIKINLLPPEKRKAERTPLPRFFLIIATAAAAALVVVYILWALFRINLVESEIQEANSTLQSLQAGVQEHDRLEGEKTLLAGKVSEIKSLITREVQWWRAVNSLWEVIHRNPRVWIDDFRTLDAMGAQNDVKRADEGFTDVPPYGITMKCHVAGSDVVELTRFRESLKNDPNLMEMLSFINFNPDWKVDPEPDFDEKESLSFSITMWGPQKPIVKRRPGGAQPAAGAPAPGAAPAGAAEAAPGGTTK